MISELLEDIARQEVRCRWIEARAMTLDRIRHLPVIDEGRVVGLVS